MIIALVKRKLGSCLPDCILSFGYSLWRKGAWLSRPEVLLSITALNLCVYLSE